MAMKRTPRPRDPIQLGKLMVDIATGQVPNAVDDGKDSREATMGHPTTREIRETPHRITAVKAPALEKAPARVRKGHVKVV